jgi:hypothetical protein
MGGGEPSAASVIPDVLSDWTLDSIRHLVESGVFETDRFDFKEHMTQAHPRRPRLAETACAFANSKGGFLVFGVREPQADLKPVDRIVGIDYHANLSEHFGAKLHPLEPSIHFEPINPPIAVPGTSRVLFVVEIPRSPLRPHSVRVNGEHRFYKRTNKGNELMTYAEIQGAFLQFEERRQRLRLLYVELLSTLEKSRAMQIAPEKQSQEYPLVTLDATVITSLLTDVYSLIQAHPGLVANLLRLRTEISAIDTASHIFYARLASQRNEEASLIRQFNSYVERTLESLIPLLEQVMSLLESEFGLTNPLSLQP